MRLERYLTEKFAGASKVGGDILEVFKNPSSTEMMEIKNSIGVDGYRYIIDFTNKAFYLANGIMLHEEMIGAIEPKIDNLNYNRFFIRGDGMDNFILGSTVGNDLSDLTSDTYEFIKRYNNDKLRDLLPYLEELNTHPTAWLSRWIPPHKVTKMIEDTIKYIKKRIDK
jgi:hypothetical protein